MHFVRAAALLAVLGSTIVAAGCGGSGGAAPPLPQTGSPPGAPLNPGSPAAQPSTTQSQNNQAQYTLQGPIVALKTGGFQMEAGQGYGYVNIYPNQNTQLHYNGLQPAVGVYAVVVALTSQGGSPVSITLSKSQPTASPQPTSTPYHGSVPPHVLTGAVIYGYGGTPTSVPISEVSPYVSWAMTDEPHAPLLRAAGVKVDVYVNFWRNYASDSPNVGYVDLEPGGAHQAAEAKDCSGHVLKDPNYGGGYESNAYTTDAAPHAQNFTTYRENEYAGAYDAVFSDDTGAVGGMVPCNYNLSTYISYTNAVSASLKVPLFVNTLNAGTTAVSQAGYANASNILGAMCESCGAYWDIINGKEVDVARYGSTWADEANAEALLVSEHKIYWGYARAIGDASQETGLRTYIYASFLLTYDPNYAMIEEAFKTPSGLEIFPETGIVPTGPLTTSTNVSGYLRSGGAYMREFSACYYRGTNMGKCAVVVNSSNTSSVSVPTTAYNHSAVLSGYSVIDGGKVSFTGSRPSSLPPISATILFP